MPKITKKKLNLNNVEKIVNNRYLGNNSNSLANGNNKSKKNNNSKGNNKKSSKCRTVLEKLEGKLAPKVVLEVRKRDNKVKGNNKFSWSKLDTREMYKNKRIVIFALPGAFTPTCSNTHLPGYERNYNKIKKLGIDEIYCLSVNDSFVMFNWCKKLKVKNVKPLPDGNAKFTKKMGALVNKSNLGFGRRSWRYSMVVDNGKIEKMFVEGGRIHNCSIDPFEVSDADTMIKYLSSKK